MHRDKVTGRFVSDVKKVQRAEKCYVNRHAHKCTKCRRKWIHPVGTIMTSHFIPFCAADYFLICDECRKK